ncbi:MAG: replication-associated recombination protein A [Candidatus Marinimicrobia bacterium]|nr:replication-associated recombination protein A [Candidatus Neomarinimicrobiota bacterium]
MTKTPLADRIRPKTLDEFVGQKHLVGRGGIIKKLIKSDQLPSMIFWGPPGSGKTTLAQVIANTTKSHFSSNSAVSTTLADVRKIVQEAKERLEAYHQKTIFFLDEIHRFNKAQQDAFLPHVEKGTIILIGATTENPSFEVIGPLLSRSRVFVLNQLNPEELKAIVKRGLTELKTKIEPDAFDFVIQASNGDARVSLNAIEIASSLIKTNQKIPLQLIKDVFQKQSLLYDRMGDEHYNTISAFIKSMRASDPDAALYYLARMVEAGEDPLFIARRMVIFASEDIGMAQPTALVVANEIFRACDAIGYPECAINLAHGVVYLAKAPKDRSAYNGLRSAQKDVKEHGNLPIPSEILNAPTKLMEELGYGKGYEPYPKNKSLLPEKLKGKKYYKK